MKILGVIPVRGGSKGVERKNLRLFAGKPLLWYSIAAARKASRLSEFLVSTEDDEIASFAYSVGAPVIRHPSHLSLDDSPTYPVVKWVIDELERQGRAYEAIAVMRATTPLRTASDIDGALDLLRANERFESVVSVNAIPGVHPVRLKRLSSEGILSDAFLPEGHSPIRRQELELLYVRNGGVYAARTAVIKTKGLWGDRCGAYVMPESRSVNINTEFQFQVAELCYLEEQRSSSTPPLAYPDQ